MRKEWSIEMRYKFQNLQEEVSSWDIRAFKPHISQCTWKEGFFTLCTLASRNKFREHSIPKQSLSCSAPTATSHRYNTAHLLPVLIPRHPTASPGGGSFAALGPVLHTVRTRTGNYDSLHCTGWWRMRASHNITPPTPLITNWLV